MRGAFKSAAPCRRARSKLNPSTLAQPLHAEFAQSPAEPCKTRRVLTLLTSRRPRALRRRARNSVLVFDLFSDLLSGQPKSDFLEPSGIARVFPKAKIVSGAPKKPKNFHSSFDVFLPIRAGNRSRVDFWPKNQWKIDTT